LSSLLYYTGGASPDRCPLCGSRNLALDVTRGELVCKSCGYVIEDTVFAYTPLAEPLPNPRNRLSLVESRRIREEHMSRRDMERLTRLLGTQVASLLEGLRDTPYTRRKLLELLRAPCVRRMLRRLEPELRAPVIQGVMEYLEEGSYPLFSELALLYGLGSKDKIKLMKRYIKKIISCFGGELGVEALSTNATPEACG